MSWSLGFDAETAAEAIEFVEQDKYLPMPIKNYIKEGLRHLPQNRPVHVEGYGHLHSGQDHQETTVTSLVVRPIAWRKKSG